ncbi:MAG: hypothetical protein IPK62_07930 [Bacteroidetes bacterium]|nr:hypothetical protein [Bacteroidota bacterium]MBK8144919.1 hypothetical protein [Bacteroidota bacterium]MBP6315678.1 hypothetical protein [Chitinophagaceae bacterium]
MKKILNVHFCIGFLIIVAFSSCNKLRDPAFQQSGYPEEIEEIIISKCATAGCHNDKSYQNAGNLNLTTFTKLLDGAVNGAVVIPFSPSQSSLMQFINTYEDLGLIASPTMPLNAPKLSREEVLLVHNWIENGCPDRNGIIPFSSNADEREKIYITNQGCDIVSVVDAETRLVMRYVKVGRQDNIPESPHNIKVTDDKKFWFVCFINGNWIQKFDAIADTLVDEYAIPNGLWNVVRITKDNSKAFVSDLSSNGQIVEVNLLTKAVKKYGNGLFNNPHGIALSKNADTLYITAQYGNMIYRLIPALASNKAISLEKGVAPVTTTGLLDPHEVVLDNSYSKYFVTCQTSNEVRVMQTGVDTLLKVIPVGKYPLEMAVSKSKELLFVTCQEDTNPNPLAKGSIYVIDMKTLTVVKIIKEKFYQPHGVAIDDKRDLLYVISRNADPNGPAPHHISECGNRNGFFHVININTWQRVSPTSEVSVDPYSADVR